MREFPNDPYLHLSQADDRTLSRYERIPELANRQIRKLMTIAKNEGLTLYFSSGSLDKWRTGYRYNPEEPSVDIAKEQAWPNFRWCLAVAMGMHFTRGSFLSEVTNELHCHERWRAKAETWASNFLAATAADIHDSETIYPDNSRTFEAVQRCGSSAFNDERQPEERPSRSKSSLRRKQNHSLCKALKTNGKPCRNYRTPGTAFCHIHNEERLPTLADIVGELCSD